MLCIGYLISKRTHSHTSCESPSLWISLQHNIFPVNGLFPFFVFLALTRTKELLLPSTPSIQWTCSRYSCRQPTDLPFHLIIYQNPPVWGWKLSSIFLFPLLPNFCTWNEWVFKQNMFRKLVSFQNVCHRGKAVRLLEVSDALLLARRSHQLTDFTLKPLAASMVQICA